MTSKNKPARPRKRQKPTGTRALLVTMVLGGTIMGWAALAQQTVGDPAAEPPLAAIPTSSASALKSMASSIDLGPIPTVVPPPAGLAATTSLSVSPQTTILQPIPAIPQPALSRPIVRTRSSR